MKNKSCIVYNVSKFSIAYPLHDYTGDNTMDNNVTSHQENNLSRLNEFETFQSAVKVLQEKINIEKKQANQPLNQQLLSSTTKKPQDLKSTTVVSKNAEGKNFHLNNIKSNKYDASQNNN